MAQDRDITFWKSDNLEFSSGCLESEVDLLPVDLRKTKNRSLG